MTAAKLACPDLAFHFIQRIRRVSRKTHQYNIRIVMFLCTAKCSDSHVFPQGGVATQREFDAFSANFYVCDKGLKGWRISSLGKYCNQKGLIVSYRGGSCISLTSGYEPVRKTLLGQNQSAFSYAEAASVLVGLGAYL